ncbi:MAG: LTA synthase family protein [Planctomycetota bacterium]|nr:LTA synthase family protein [Planctomycetota bacterium]MDA1215154.1 LTA synthase family protein [Planctomycetota bacterium]
MTIPLMTTRRSNSDESQPTSSRFSSNTRIARKIASLLGPYCVVFLIALACIVVFGLLRASLLIAYGEVDEWTIETLAEVFWLGLRFDLLVAFCLVLWQAWHVAIVPQSRLLRPISRICLECEWIIISLFLPLLCLVEWIFFDEFQSRLNYIAIEYLVYPTEVCCNIWESYAVVPWCTAILLLGGTTYYFVRRPLLAMMAQPASTPHRWGITAGILAAIAGLWSTTDMDHRDVSNDRVAVECSNNGLYSLVYYAWTCRFDFNQNYITISEKEADRELRKAVVGTRDRLQAGSLNPVDRIVSAQEKQRPWNVVLILEESFGSDFVGVLGNKQGLTPHFDRLSRDALMFDNIYATGNRTARALEAVLTSMPPLPTESILKRDHSDRVFTLANVLADRGYERLFMTGGRGIFDGVGEFMTDNGFNHFVDQADFDDPLFVNAWGVSDEDLFRESLVRMDDLHATGKPFFATLLTVSNHRPYTFPEGRVSDMRQTRENAVRYADWALGYFFREAKSHDFYKNTLFVVMGDHGARIYGSQFFPMKSYRIPVLIIPPAASDGPDNGVIKGTRCHTLACSLDIAPTIMGRLGGSYRSVFFGYDILRTKPEEGRAVMQHNHDVAVLDANNHMVVLGFNHTKHGFVLDPTHFKLKKSKQPDPQLLLETIALFQSTYELYYDERWYPQAAQLAIMPQ